MPRIFLLSGSVGTTVLFEGTTPVTLTNGTGGTTTFEPNLEGRHGTSGKLEDIRSGETKQLAAGEYHLYLGGSVTSSVDQPAGTYNGDFDITVSCATQ